MRASSFLLIPLLAAAACGGGSKDPGPQPTASAGAPAAPELSNSDIIQRVYDPEYSVPAGFFVDERADTDRSYTLHHVLDGSGAYELCSDDYQAAVNLEAADHASRAVQGTFIAATETPRYWEFTRELAYTDDVGNISEPTSPGFARVFKCSNTERTGVDRSLMDGYAGVINARPVDAHTIREFTEYLWQFRFFADGRRIVLESRGETAADDISHKLLLARRNSQGPDRCDLVEVSEWVFSVDRATGSVDKTLTVLRNFEAQWADGGPRLCE